MPGWRSSRQNWAGTPDQPVTLCFAVSWSQVSGSQGPGAGNTSVAGKAAALMRTATRPDTWNMGLETMKQLRGEGPVVTGAAPVADTVAMAALRRLTIAKLTMLRCESVAPFGRPVVPLVNKMTAGESSVIAAVG